MSEEIIAVASLWESAYLHIYVCIIILLLLAIVCVGVLNNGVRRNRMATLCLSE